MELFDKAIHGCYAQERFTPEFIDREMFFRDKDTDGYTCIMFSFANDQRTYLYGRKVEDVKHKLHDFVVYGVWDDRLYDYFERIPDIGEATGHNYQERRIKLKRLHDKGERLDIEHLERLQHLEKLQHLERLCRSYDEYTPEAGDIVYCDIPYVETSKDYQSGAFDHGRFYDWAEAQDYPVYISSTRCEDPRFVSLTAKLRQAKICATGNAKHMEEHVFMQKRFVGQYMRDRWGI